MRVGRTGAEARGVVGRANAETMSMGASMDQWSINQRHPWDCCGLTYSLVLAGDNPVLP